MISTRKTILTVLVFCVLAWGGVSPSLSAQNEVLLSSLDKILEHRGSYFIQKDKYLDYLKGNYRQSESYEEKFNILQQIFDEYKVYNVDSLLRYSLERRNIAAHFYEPVYKQAANMNYAEALYLSGMYKESFDVLGRMTVEPLDSTLMPYWFHLQHTIYGAMYENTTNKEFKKYYFEKAHAFGDSILSVSDSSSFIYKIVASDMFYKEGNCNKASFALNSINEETLSQHEKAILAYCKANVCKCVGNVEEEIKYLASASILEIPIAVREYSALQQLALLLYEKGDIDRAYKYLRCAFEDMIGSHMRMRVEEVTAVYPIVESAYRAQLYKGRQKLIVLTVILVFIVLILVALLYSYARHLKTIKRLRQMAEMSKSETERTLSEMNSLNMKISQINTQLNEANAIKEKYLVQYMALCSIYIDHFENIRAKVRRMIREGNPKKEDLKSIMDEKRIENILEDFYENFDETFLGLFPSFISKFNELMQEDKRVDPPLEPNRMNTPLRIYALVRLGVSDSVQIAQFLRYSVSTIYNWRVKIRNNSLVDRERFDEYVMKIK